MWSVFFIHCGVLTNHGLNKCNVDSKFKQIQRCVNDISTGIENLKYTKLRDHFNENKDKIKHTY